MTRRREPSSLKCNVTSSNKSPNDTNLLGMTHNSSLLNLQNLEQRQLLEPKWRDGPLRDDSFML